MEPITSATMTTEAPARDPIEENDDDICKTWAGRADWPPAGGGPAPGSASAAADTPTKPERQPSAQEVHRAIAKNRGAITTPFGNAFAGNPRGTITLVEFYDYNCGYCRASQTVIAQALARHPDVRIVYRELPILGPASREAARLSLAAAAQGKFAAFHDLLFVGGRVTPEGLATAAAKTGVDTRQAAALAPRVDAEIAQNLALSRQLGFTGTPSWVVGGRAWSAAPTLKELEQAIAEARQRRPA